MHPLLNAVLSPILIITAIAIKIEDPGPAIFSQYRVGRYGKLFKMYKFRSMAQQSPDDEKKGWTTKDDPRVTRVGRIMRKTSLDELPQLFNILKGDMAVIGPRPFIPEEQAALPSDRLLVKPGLSCYWQIGGKNALSEEESIALDRKYIMERSVMTDVTIVLKTVLLARMLKNGTVISESRYFFAPFRKMLNQAPEILCESEYIGNRQWQVTLRCSSFVWLLHLAEPDGTACSDNDFDLWPGEARTVTVTSDQTSFKPDFSFVR